MAVNVEHKRIPHFVCACVWASAHHVKEIDSRRLPRIKMNVQNETRVKWRAKYKINQKVQQQQK